MSDETDMERAIEALVHAQDGDTWPDAATVSAAARLALPVECWVAQGGLTQPTNLRSRRSSGADFYFQAYGFPVAGSFCQITFLPLAVV